MSAEPKERPIVLDATEVRSILAGRKTQIRRLLFALVGDRPVYGPGFRTGRFAAWEGTVADDGWPIQYPLAGGEPVRAACPFGAPGELLWGQESYAPGYFDDGSHGYRADWDGRAADLVPEPRWRAPVTMPREASRIRLDVAAVRVELLQRIGDSGAVAEGAMFTDYGYSECRISAADDSWGPRPFRSQRRGWSMEPKESSDECLGTARDAFANWWNKRNGKRAPWESNPWVWVVTFREVEKES